MQISIFGLGYVGSVSAACLAEKGHGIIGVDPNPAKVAMINAGEPPVVEAGLPELIRKAVEKKLLRATSNAEEAVLATEISIICVGTPSHSDGGLDTRHLEHACGEIGAALAVKKDYHIVAVRSTVLPGTTRDFVIPILERRSGKKAGVDFGVCINPEFMREGSSVQDFNCPPKTVIGETDARAGDKLASLYEGLPCPLIRCAIEVSEMIKYSDNAWHATKVAFANEIGIFCKAHGIDSHTVMGIFCKDTKLNLSPCYLRPGFAFGGSCLPKDVRALGHRAGKLGLAMPLLGALIPSNEEQLEIGIRMILETGLKNIGILGISFKAGTDDLRESPMVRIIARLMNEGLTLRLYDGNVDLARLIGANRDYILKAIPQIDRLMQESLDGVLEKSEAIIIGNNAPEFAAIASRLRQEQNVIDFVRIKSIEESHANYRGICW